MSGNQSLVQRKETEFSLAGWIIAVAFFIFVAIPLAVLMYTTTVVVYAIKEFTDYLKKTIKNAKAKSKPVAPKILL